MLVLPINTKSFSHASGSIPYKKCLFYAVSRFFPREWEYTHDRTAATFAPFLFPTRVGVAQILLIGHSKRLTFSHASGSDPSSGKFSDISRNFFPREWECTYGIVIGLGFCLLFPTRVGVYL